MPDFPLPDMATLKSCKLALVDWQLFLGKAWPKVQPFLIECVGEITPTYPHPRTGLRLIVQWREDRLIAFPEDGFEYDSEDFELTLKDVALWRIDESKTTVLEAVLFPQSAPPPAMGVRTASPVPSLYSIARGLNSWRVIFDGVEIPGIGKNRGMFYVAYLLNHAGEPPIHALELEAKSLVFLRRECGISEIINQDTGEETALDVDAVIEELNLGRDDSEIESRLVEAEKKAFSVIQTSQSDREKRSALAKVQAIRDFRRLRFKAGSNPADLAARRVRTSIDRLCHVLHQYRGDKKAAVRAAHSLADYVEQHIRSPSAALWPRNGRAKKGVQPGHFQCVKQDELTWSIQ